jgi:predicted acetyltransferase
MIYRPYDSERDEKAVIRIWQECGWPDLKKSKKNRVAFRDWVSCGTADVVEFRGEAESLVTSHPGSITMLDTDLSFQAVTSVTVGRPMRRMGGAGELTAMVVSRAAEEGFAVSGLGIFDQGFYDKLGFGNFPYSRTVTVDPLTLTVPELKRPPIRLTKKDISRMIENTSSRFNHHGLVKIPPEGFMRLIVEQSDDCFGLGFEDNDGYLSHHLWAKSKGPHGPYEVWWMVYRDFEGLMELLSLMRNLGDQVNAFKFREPWGVQIQDLVKRPFRTRDISTGGEFATSVSADSTKQARILNMGKVLSALRLPAGKIRFNLDMIDPIEGFLPVGSAWRGVGGEWIVTLDEKGSGAVRGSDGELPVMRTSVNALTRLVFGAATPRWLSATGEIQAPADLVCRLDEILRLPVPDMVQIF